MYLLVSGGHICTPQRDRNMASRYNVFPNISHMKHRTDLILGEVLCIFIFFYILDSGLSVLNGLQFYF